MKELRDTIDLMISENYKDRFKAEYYQVETRLLKLYHMCIDWDLGKLNFEPTCPREIYDRQFKSMFDYLFELINRAAIEQVGIEVDPEVRKLIHFIYGS